MHYRVQVRVRLHEPLMVEDESPEGEVRIEQLAGYYIVMAVNAGDMVAAEAMAHAVALAPEDADGIPRAFEGQVERTESEALVDDSWPDASLPFLASSEEPGVYYKTGLVFFGPEPTETMAEPLQPRKWWHFWK